MTILQYTIYRKQLGGSGLKRPLAIYSLRVRACDLLFSEA